jgi:hypothetical protein
MQGGAFLGFKIFHKILLAYWNKLALSFLTGSIGPQSGFPLSIELVVLNRLS